MIGIFILAAACLSGAISLICQYIFGPTGMIIGFLLAFPLGVWMGVLGHRKGIDMNITIDQIIKAAEKNGFPWDGYKSDRSGVDSYCILQQASYHLWGTFGWVKLADALNDLGYQNNAGTNIWRYNDNKAESYEDAVRFLKEELSKFPVDTVLKI